MKKRDPKREATIHQYSMIGARHWYVIFTPELNRPKCAKFNELRDARQFALKYVYAKNITVFD